MKDLSWHRRHAIQVASMLPEKDEDALIVLRLASELVTNFLREPSTEKPAPTVVLIGGGQCA